MNRFKEWLEIAKALNDTDELRTLMNETKQNRNASL
jgi:hypothetical protein